MRYCIFAILMGILLPFGAIAVAPPGHGPQVLLEEDFAGPLKPGWSWVREQPAAWRLDRESLVLDILPGSLWLNANSTKNLLLRPAPVADRPGFSFDAVVECRPEAQFEHAGLICYFDDDNWVAFTKEYTTRTELTLLAEYKGQPKIPAEGFGYEKAGVRLRMTVAGGKVVASFSDPRRGPFYLIGECPLPASAKPLQMGLIAGQGTKGGAHQARFSEFRIIAAR